MPRNGSGSYSLPQPAFVPGTTISSSAVNSDLSDIAAALTASVAADGQTPLTGSLKLPNGTAALPAITFVTDPTTGIYLASAGNLGMAANGVQTVQFSGTAVGVSDNILTFASGAIPCPVGTIVDWVGTSAPTGWLLLFGQVVAQASYPGLFLVCGTTYNTGGEGAGNFRLPDCRGRIGVGKDNMGGSAANRITTGGCGVDGTTLGANGGEQTHTLVAAEVGTHTHTISDPGHTHSGVVGTSTNQFAGPGQQAPQGPTSIGTSMTGITGTNANAGGGAHNNAQPLIIFNKIIFAGR